MEKNFFSSISVEAAVLGTVASLVACLVSYLLLPTAFVVVTGIAVAIFSSIATWRALKSNEIEVKLAGGGCFGLIAFFAIDLLVDLIVPVPAAITKWGSLLFVACFLLGLIIMFATANTIFSKK